MTLSPGSDILIASSNPGKLREFERIFSAIDVRCKPQSAFAIEDAVEDGLSFVENAIIKARHAAKLSGLPTLADDSGLIVPALDGDPGVYSARYGGDNTTDQKNTEHLLHNMKGIQNRSAYFYCCLVLMQHADDPAPLIAEGRWQGEISEQASGAGGFGYDPVFRPEGHERTFGEMRAEEKHGWPPGTQGLSLGQPDKKMGQKGSHTCDVILEDVRVPAANIIGGPARENQGFKTAMKVLDNGRIEVAAQATGIADAALGAAISYAKERQVSGQAISEFQGLQWMLADCATELAAARALAMQAATLRGTGVRYSSESAFAKLYATEAAWRIADRALQIHGGYGYTRDFPLERYLRDLRIFRIYEGSSEIQRTIIARGLLS